MNVCNFADLVVARLRYAFLRLTPLPNTRGTLPGVMQVTTPTGCLRV
uniref:Uncharacterized protein n=1 Tax=Candidatus Kentrum sp. MB TaxID=2138164 RepID=A0A450Y1A0_9GAMM|nr:MAG: hypothetical protein BECKMB1821G_GA0114241_11109 [Candidatus Kentron sp. MB]VFK35305.1 MAG: hypothetical protein BECKMB1821I_GA0114274_11109 [Candidatus Kentron sp. MB]VFK77229.1 MAG: hypothetical protein BECKMB1821H_GA0114242_11129 [Candidatus Kentron sp. MB]